MKIAFYNIENLFFRHRELLEKPKSHNHSNWREELDNLMNTKSNRRYERIRELVYLLGFEHKDPFRYGYLNRKGMVMAMKPQHYELATRAGEITNWQGWIEIENRPLPTRSIHHKAQIIAETNADVLVLQEVESKPAVKVFLEKYLSHYPIAPYRDLSFSQGNDDRGLDQAVLVRKGIMLDSMGIYNQERESTGAFLFDRDFTAFRITGKTESFWILAVQFTAGIELKEELEKKRYRQSQAVARVYQQLREQGNDHILVLGSLFAVSYCYSLSPLLQDTDLKSISRHPQFLAAKDHGKDKDYYSLGAYGRGLNLKEEVYLLASPGMYSKIKRCGIDRRAIWPGTENQWRILTTLKQKEEQASQHPVLWMEVKF
ncbi:hypothetical protein C7S20_02525 [Christiangramia fulva]|uniref:Endonuclease/exonuclease/phosphatase n=1 Tax=Christiangramia fulva TaxID=2126553 RepID=A0A2R3Z1V2_9FLAO|nr:hypothetical protein [Christiangramia fulva]AVR44226.1 hypothetical protein C7S20_02525 [Christiangramia fulva]